MFPVRSHVSYNLHTIKTDLAFLCFGLDWFVYYTSKAVDFFREPDKHKLQKRKGKSISTENKGGVMPSLNFPLRVALKGRLPFNICTDV